MRMRMRTRAYNKASCSETRKGAQFVWRLWFVSSAGRPHVATAQSTSDQHGDLQSEKRESVSTLDDPHGVPDGWWYSKPLFRPYEVLHFNSGAYRWSEASYRNYTSTSSKDEVYAQVVSRQWGERITEDKRCLGTSPTLVCPCFFDTYTP